MPEELQGLLDRIHKDGIQKMEVKKKELIKQAQKEADAILKNANAEAEHIIKKSKETAKRDEERAKATIQQTARDVIIALKAELLDRMNICIKNLVSDAMTPDLMSNIILKMADSYSKTSGKNDSLSLIFSPKDLDKMTKHFNVNLAKNLKDQPEIFEGLDFGAGLKIGFKGSDVFLDFSDNALTEIITGYVGPRLASMLEGKDDT